MTGRASFWLTELRGKGTRWLMTGRASFWLTELRGKGTKLDEGDSQKAV